MNDSGPVCPLSWGGRGRGVSGVRCVCHPEAMSVEDWQEYGSPTDWNPKVKRALELIRAIYAVEPTGGPLHVILDDWNIEDGDIRLEATAGTSYTPDEFIEEDDAEEVRVAVAELVPLLGTMTLDERASALARHWGHLPTATEA